MKRTGESPGSVRHYCRDNLGRIYVCLYSTGRSHRDQTYDALLNSHAYPSADYVGCRV